MQSMRFMLTAIDSVSLFFLEELLMMRQFRCLSCRPVILDSLTRAARAVSTKSAIAFAAFFLPAVASAVPQTLTIGSDIEFSGGQAPASATHPWILLSIADSSPNSVVLTLTAPNLTGSENMSEFYFNIDPALSMDLDHLIFSNLVKGGSFDTPTIDQGENAFKADGDGKYDIHFSFATGGNVSKTFTTGDSLQYTITGAGISASSFDFMSAPDGGHGPFITAAHIQNTTGVGNGGSGWVADTTGGTIVTQIVPEPSSVALFALGSVGMAVWGRRRIRKTSSRPCR
jgi:PEP-CTERM motif